ncbi:MAG: amidohydrolase [Proteobacteria bacterium]|nr:amidohydrolase [Pseudomonadota bacterium]
MKCLLTILAGLIGLQCANPAAAAGGEKAADLVLVHGHVRTLDADPPEAEAVAIREGRIVLVGSDEQVAKLQGRATRRIDLAGRTLLPGLADAHVHPMEGEFLHHRLCNVRALSVEEGLQKLKGCVDAAPAGEWVAGYGWYDLDNPGFDSITRAQMDAVSSSRKLAVLAHDHHTLWVNSRVLESLGIDEHTPSPPGGEIVRDPVTHQATGMLIDAAQNRVVEEIEYHSAYSASVRDLSRAALKHLNSLGITSIVDAFADEDRLNAYRALDRAGQLTARVVVAMAVTPANFRTEIPRIAERRDAVSSANVRVGFVKVFGDGNPEVGMSSFLSHDGRPGAKSPGYYTDEEFRELVELAERHGLPVYVHVIGDGAVRQALDAVALARAAHPQSHLRHTLTHLTWVDPADLPRFRQLGVLANIQEGWMAPAAYGGPPGYDYARSTAAGPIGPWLAGRMNPYRELADAGASLSTGSDWFYTDENPWNDLEAGATSKDPGGANRVPMLPNSTVDLPRLLAARTAGSAYLVGRENDLGRIRVGYRADLVVVDRDPLTVPIESVHETRVDLTLLDGRVVYQR